MNQTIIELRLSTDSKQRAAKIIEYLQAMSSGTNDQTVGIALHSEIEQHANIISATYRERREGD